MLYKRRVWKKLKAALDRQAAVVLLGPRQVGKTTLAMEIGKLKEALYLDLENPKDLKKLDDPSVFLRMHSDKLIILDEIHRAPDLFMVVRGIIDEGRRTGNSTGRFMFLGSASMSVLNQSGESLAGRIEYVDLNPLDILEVSSNGDSRTDAQKSKLLNLWVRGGYPQSFLAESDEESNLFRENLIRTYLTRDVELFGGQMSSATQRKLWSWLANGHGTTVNLSNMAKNFSVKVGELSRYVDLLLDLMLVRRLEPHTSNQKMRLVKTPKLYIRDSGILHRLLNIERQSQLLVNKMVGVSWEGFVIENLLNSAPWLTLASYYGTASGDEIDLILELPGTFQKWAVEIKSGSKPKLSRGFHNACKDLNPDRKFLVYQGTEQYRISDDTTAIGVHDFSEMLQCFSM